jgi:hypothetical protein
MCYACRRCRYALTEANNTAIDRNSILMRHCSVELPYVSLSPSGDAHFPTMFRPLNGSCELYNRTNQQKVDGNTHLPGSFRDDQVHDSRPNVGCSVPIKDGTPHPPPTNFRPYVLPRADSGISLRKWRLVRRQRKTAGWIVSRNLQSQIHFLGDNKSLVKWTWISLRTSHPSSRYRPMYNDQWGHALRQIIHSSRRTSKLNVETNYLIR